MPKEIDCSYFNYASQLRVLQLAQGAQQTSDSSLSTVINWYMKPEHAMEIFVPQSTIPYLVFA